MNRPFDMTACTVCEAANGPNNRFCSSCGSALSSSCRSCAEPLDAAARFCGHCGAATYQAETPQPVPVKSAPVAERRVCSVLFCDLVGFTSHAESRDAEEVRELLSRYFDTARAVILRYGGVVEKFIGDAVMAVWGTPIVREGDTERAVRAALDLVGAVAALGLEIDAPTLQARAGVVTGEVAVTIGATSEGMVAGDVVNTAARVQAAACPGTVFVDEPTRRLAEAAVAFAGAGRHALKGKALPQQLWSVSHVLAGVGGAQRLDGLEARLVGRDLQSRLIRDLFHEASERRQPQLVVVSGAAGVGKSRLGWEFEKYVDGLASSMAWHRGRCLSYGDGVAFWALAEIVRQRLGIADEDPADVASAKLVEGIAAVITPRERDYVGVRLGRLLGLEYGDELTTDLSRDELFAGWRLWFERLAETQPVVLLIEDLHFADAGLLDFLDHLVTWAKGVPLFVLGFARPEFELARPGWASGRHRTHIVLESLDDKAIATLLDLLVPGIPAQAVATISALAEGVPLFAVETVRSLIDRDIVVRLDGVYRLVGDIGTLTVPASLHELLAARLDALPPDVRALIADASVIGSTFPAEALIAVSAVDEEQVHSGLLELVRRGVLEISADPLSPQRGNYHFAHEMLRQVAHNTLSRRDRKARHLGVAAHLRRAFPGDGEELIYVVARHYLDALSAVPDDPDAFEIREQALAALARAGERGLRTGSPGRAAQSFIAAADLHDEQSDEVSLRASAAFAERAAEAAHAAAWFAAAIDYAQRASDAFLKLGDTRSAARSRVIVGMTLRGLGRFAQARECLRGTLEVLSGLPDETTVLALGQLALLETSAGTKDADALSEEVLALGQALDIEPNLLARLLTGRALHLSHNGRDREAAALLREAARLAEEVGNARFHGMALLNLSDVLCTRDPTAAAKYARQAAPPLRRAGDRDLLAFALSNLAGALVALGDWDAADQVLQDTATTDMVNDSDPILLRSAWLSALRGDIEGMEGLTGQLTDYQSSEAPQELAGLDVTRGLAAAATEQWTEALTLGISALHHVDALGIASEELRWAWPLAARAAFECEDPAATRDLLARIQDLPRGHLPPVIHAERALVRARSGEGSFDEAIVLLRDRSTPYHLAQGLLDYADHLQCHGSHAEADPLIDEAIEIANRLGTPFIARRGQSLCVSSLRSRQ